MQLAACSCAMLLQDYRAAVVSLLNSLTGAQNSSQTTKLYLAEVAQKHEAVQSYNAHLHCVSAGRP